ncbi:MAG: NAD(+)/NADH kinase [Ignavibacterium sp.]
MIIGIVGNSLKKDIAKVVLSLINILKEKELDFYISNSLINICSESTLKSEKNKFLPNDKLAQESDIIVSIGGDGTMLTTAYKAHLYNKPVVGVNFGKLGFLTEVDVKDIDFLIDEIINGRYTIEERMVLIGECSQKNEIINYAINDIVIEKGGWSKMIEIRIDVDDEYVTTFAADGIIIATPTGSTGYSLSCGGPIVSPKSNVITLSPISPHTLSMRPLVLDSNQKIKITADSQFKNIQINSDGQRVIEYQPPIEVNIKKSERPFKLVHLSSKSYFEILRNKLLWGLDLRNKN